MGTGPIDFYDPSLPGVRHDRALEAREQLAIDLLRPVMAAPKGSVLDVGCGSGIFLDALDRQLGLMDRGWDLHGVDYSAGALEVAAALPYEFRRCNLDEGIPHENGRFDVVTMGEVIEHVYNPDAVLAECARILRPGGHLLVTTPNVQAWYNRILFLAGIQPLFVETSTQTKHIGAGPLRRFIASETPVGHVRLFNRRALEDSLRHQGFEVRQVGSAPFTALPGPVREFERRVLRRASLGSILVVVARTPAAASAVG